MDTPKFIRTELLQLSPKAKALHIYVEGEVDLNQFLKYADEVYHNFGKDGVMQVSVWVTGGVTAFIDQRDMGYWLIGLTTMNTLLAQETARVLKLPNLAVESDLVGHNIIRSQRDRDILQVLATARPPNFEQIIKEECDRFYKGMIKAPAHCPTCKLQFTNPTTGLVQATCHQCNKPLVAGPPLAQPRSSPKTTSLRR